MHRSVSTREGRLRGSLRSRVVGLFAALALLGSTALVVAPAAEDDALAALGVLRDGGLRQPQGVAEREQREHARRGEEGHLEAGPPCERDERAEHPEEEDDGLAREPVHGRAHAGPPAGRMADAVATARPDGQPITASFGVTSGSGPRLQFGALLAEADVALYEAKAAGGDQVRTTGGDEVGADGPVPQPV